MLSSALFGLSGHYMRDFVSMRPVRSKRGTPNYSLSKYIHYLIYLAICLMMFRWIPDNVSLSLCSVAPVGQKKVYYLLS